jgi:cation transport protein ChaC
MSRTPARHQLRLTRDLVDRLPRQTDERGPAILPDPTEQFYADTAGELLTRLEPQGHVWIFAAGSLIWNPRMEVEERRAARIEGWQRAFCLTDRRYRGSPSRPGLMMSLDRGGACDGVALRMKPHPDPAAPLIDLLKKEPPVPPELVTAETDAGRVEVLLFVARETMPLYRPEPPIEELAEILATSVGHIGTMAEYLLNTVTELDRIGVHDPHLWRLQDLVAERLEAL